MKSKPKHQESEHLFQQSLEQLLDQRQPLYKLANKLPWSSLEESFESFYKQGGRPALPIRLMAGLLLLKQLENLSDERVCQAWQQNPYMQYFCGESYFQWKLPCDPSELVHFRKRIGEKGIESILAMTVQLHCDKLKKEDELVADTTVQESNVKFPTDTRLYVDCIHKLWNIGRIEGVKWRRRYTRKVPELLALLRTRSNRIAKPRRKARRKLKTIAGRLHRDLKRKAASMGDLRYADDLATIDQILKQKRHDKGKVYSLHDPDVLCIAKGKVHKKYEFGRKASIAMLRESCVIVSATSYSKNIYDGDTLKKTLEQACNNAKKTFACVLADKGYRGRSEVSGTRIEIPRKPSKKLNSYQRSKQRKRNGRRAAIEPVIGHLKNNFRMSRCYLKGALGSSLNVALAASAWNLKLWINELVFVLILLIEQVVGKSRLAQSN